MNPFRIQLPAIVVLGLKSLATAVNFCLSYGPSLHSVELITEIGNWKCFKPIVALWVKHHQSHRGFLRAAFDHCQRLWMGLFINEVKYFCPKITLEMNETSFILCKLIKCKENLWSCIIFSTYNISEQEIVCVAVYYLLF